MRQIIIGVGFSLSSRFNEIRLIKRKINELEKTIRLLREDIRTLKEEFSYIRERFSEIEEMIEKRATMNRSKKIGRKESYAWIMSILRECGLLTPISEGGSISLLDAEGRKVTEIRYRRLLERVIERVKIVYDENGREWLVAPELYNALIRKLPLNRKTAEKSLNEKEEKLLELLNRAGKIILKDGVYTLIED